MSNNKIADAFAEAQKEKRAEAARIAAQIHAASQHVK